MKVFITWSGKRSRYIAAEMRDWLPKVIQVLDPFMSEEDIEKGTRWSDKIARNLEDTHVGLICLTPENIDKPWVNFEAGALSKSLKDGRVCTYLFGLRESDVTGPLNQFQHTLADKEHTGKLLAEWNRLLQKPLSDKTLEFAFEKAWPELEEALKKVPSLPSPVAKKSRDDRELLEEILQNTRSLVQQRIIPPPPFPLPPIIAPSVPPKDLFPETAEKALTEAFLKMFKGESKKKPRDNAPSSEVDGPKKQSDRAKEKP